VIGSEYRTIVSFLVFFVCKQLLDFVME